MRRVYRFDRALQPGRVGKIAFQIIASGTAAGIVGFTMAHRVNREEIALRSGGNVVVAGEQLTLPDVSDQPTTPPLDPLSGTPVPVEVSRDGSPDSTPPAEAPGAVPQQAPIPAVSGISANPTTTVVELPLGRISRAVTAAAIPTTTAPSTKTGRSTAGASLGPEGSDGVASPEPDLIPNGSINDAGPRVETPPAPTLVLVAGPPFTPNTAQPAAPSSNDPLRSTEPQTEPTFEPVLTIPSTTKATTPTTKATPTTAKAASAASKTMTATKAPLVATTTTSSPTVPPVSSTTRLNSQTATTTARYVTTTAASSVPTTAVTKGLAAPTTTIDETTSGTSPTTTTMRSSATTIKPSLTLTPSLSTTVPVTSTSTSTLPPATTTPAVTTSTTNPPATSTTTSSTTSSTTTTTTTIQPPKPSAIEAEDCRLSGDVKELSAAKGFSGRAYVSMQSITSGTIDCTMVATTAGRYVVGIHVMSDKDAKIAVTQGTVRKIVGVVAAKTDNWSNGEWISVELDFVEGPNTIVLTASEIGSGSIHVDRLEATFKQADQTNGGTVVSSTD